VGSLQAHFRAQAALKLGAADSISSHQSAALGDYMREVEAALKVASCGIDFFALGDVSRLPRGALPPGLRVTIGGKLR
jgi:hypothetical protein